MIAHEVIMTSLFLLLFPQQDTHHLLLEGGQLGLYPCNCFIAVKHDAYILRSMGLGDLFGSCIRCNRLLEESQVLFFYGLVVET